MSTDVKPENLLRDFGLGPDVDDIVEAIMNKETAAGKDGRSAPLWIPHVKDTDLDQLNIVLSDFSHGGSSSTSFLNF